jgi:hypothetical protein
MSFEFWMIEQLKLQKKTPYYNLLDNFRKAGKKECICMPIRASTHTKEYI